MCWQGILSTEGFISSKIEQVDFLNFCQIQELRFKLVFVPTFAVVSLNFDVEWKHESLLWSLRTLRSRVVAQPNDRFRVGQRLRTDAESCFCQSGFRPTFFSFASPYCLFFWFVTQRSRTVGTVFVDVLNWRLLTSEKFSSLFLWLYIFCRVL